MNESNSLAIFTEASKMLAEANTIQKAKELKSLALTAADWAKRKGMGERAIAHCRSYAFEAERKMGEMLAQTERAKPPGRNQHSKKEDRYRDVTDAPTLSEIGVSKRESSNAQKLAALPKETFEALKAGSITRSKVIHEQRREAKNALAKELDSKPIPKPDGKFDVIVADPPWRYESRAEDLSHRSRSPYPEMSVSEICALPVGKMAEKDSILWLWTTNAFMRQAFQVLDAWGFEEKTILTWVKPKMGLGDWLRGATEHCILAIRGKPVVTLTNQTTSLAAPAREHSRKPDEFFELVNKLCHGRKLELFSREARKGWSAWGAEKCKF